ncbi:MAG: Zinc/iron permease [candidate division WS6 bacterium GW2011_GWF2_39_15]|uniref:Zinc/iron permease n=1 Tax=candidate division WS6 bacterium GW2011_GWF2_39_15 TaxID=1619100 RepID=A0A0G0MQ26_9BACT|nr:MAG: Zinc/iron permease [candidate division WS6 bacterium GW2011_GWF2_39_15]
MFLYILIITILISSLSYIALLLLNLKRNLLHDVTDYLIALSAGTMIGTAFLHLIPESIPLLGGENTFVLILISFLFFFIIEKAIHWHHSHNSSEYKNTTGHMNLIGDALHNFIDGILIAGTFAIDIRLGVLTSLSVALHELPQELGDYGVLIHAGWGKIKALKANILVSVTMIFGGLLGYFLSTLFGAIIPYLSIIAAGGFIYISASDLIPQLKSENKIIRSIFHIGIFSLGILLTYAFRD